MHNNQEHVKLDIFSNFFHEIFINIYIKFVKELILLQESNFNVKRQTNIKSSIILTMLSKECSQRWEK